MTTATLPTAEELSSRKVEQTAKNGIVIGAKIYNVSWDSVTMCQRAIALLQTGEVVRVWRGGYEAHGCGWIISR